MKWLLPVFFVIIAFGIFFGYVDGAYQDTKSLHAEVQNYDDALQKSKELQAIRDALLSRYNTFSSADLERLEKMLPDNIDNVRLVLELDSIAAQYGMRVSGVVINEEVTTNAEGTVGPSNEFYDTVVLSFNVTGSYENFIAFLQDIESNLRVADITTLAFDGDSSEAVYTYSLGIRTYWLR